MWDSRLPFPSSLLSRTPNLAHTAAKADPIPKVTFVDNEPEFRWTLLADQMAFDKLHEGIVKFAADAVTLKDSLKKQLA